MERVSIVELKRAAGERPAGYVVWAQVESANEKVTKGGKPFVEVKLADAEDSFVLRVWSDSEMFGRASGWRGGECVAVEGEWTSNEYGLDPRSWNVVLLGEDESAQLMAGSAALREKQAADYAFLERAIEVMADPRLKAVCRLFLGKFGDRFKRSAGARTYHHARRGGLVEHVAQMARSAEAVCGVYPELNRDLLVAGVVFHDSGKLWENCYLESGFTMPYTLPAELLGHIPMGIELVNKLWREMLEDGERAGMWKAMEPATEEVRLHLLHLIGAHHGELAFGSPVLPKTPEAAALHYIDNLDAKMEMFFKGYEVAAVLGKDIYERVRPLPSRMVKPLGKVEG